MLVKAYLSAAGYQEKGWFRSWLSLPNTNL